MFYLYRIARGVHESIDFWLILDKPTTRNIVDLFTLLTTLHGCHFSPHCLVKTRLLIPQYRHVPSHLVHQQFQLNFAINQVLLDLFDFDRMHIRVVGRSSVLRVCRAPRWSLNEHLMSSLMLCDAVVLFDLIFVDHFCEVTGLSELSVTEHELIGDLFNLVIKLLLL